MELRRLTTDCERNVFTARLAEARARHATGFEDTPRTIAYNRARLAAADIFAIFEHCDDPVERMLAGVTLHDLDAFPQSCSRPNLTHLPRGAVLECADHWSLSRCAGVLAWRGIALQVVHRAPSAVLIYLAVRGADHGGFYSAMGFRSAGDPVEYTHLQRADHAPLFVQPMLLEGADLARLTASVRALKFEALDNFGTIRFEKADRLRPATPAHAPTLTTADLYRRVPSELASQSMEL
jgi:hypothetical protein